jgi:hypothetical protein
MSTSCTHDRLRPHAAPVQPAEETAQPSDRYGNIRDALGLRRQRLDAICPAALDLAAEAQAALGDYLCGCATEYAGDHAAPVWLRALRGGYPLGEADIARLAIQAPDAAEVWLRTIAARAGFLLVPVTGDPGGSITTRAAGVGVALADLVKGAAEAEADGEVSATEIADLCARRAHVRSELAHLDACIESAAACGRDAKLWRPEVARRVALHTARAEALR